MRTVRNFKDVGTCDLMGVEIMWYVDESRGDGIDLELHSACTHSRCLLSDDFLSPTLVNLTAAQAFARAHKSTRLAHKKLIGPIYR